MPKKLSSNPKALEARSRQEEKKRSEEDRKRREAEDALWRDDDKDLARKQKRREEGEKKKQEAAERKAVTRALLEEEMTSIKGRGSGSEGKKVTRSEIEASEEKRRLKEQQERELREKERRKISLPTDLPLENINRIVVEGEEARTVEEAISVLSVKDTEEGDRHPEKRMKAAYLAFEERRLPEMKTEYPNMRLSQWKQILKKEWLKSPENPLNQSTVAYNKHK